MKEDLKVAVWMVTYNQEAYVEQAITSVMMQQTSFNFHLFIGEDCSTDKTAQICKQLQESYPGKITLVANKNNLGPTNNAFQVYDLCLKSDATYIAMLEGDDYWSDPLKLQKQVDFLEAEPVVVFCFTRFLTLQENLELTDKNKHFFKNEEHLIFDFEMFTKGWYGGTLTLMFKASAINMETIKKYQHFRDIYLYTELLKNGTGICLNFDSAVYRTLDTGVYSSASKLERAKMAVMCYRELYANNNSILALKIKYYYFATNYIKQLIQNNQIIKAMVKTISFASKMKDFGFFKKMIKEMIKLNKVTSYIKSFIKKRKRSKAFESSGKYWEDRYVANKNSGAGSYGRLANFKAEILNAFVAKENIQTVIEYGCGDGNQLSLANYPKYIGFDVSEKALEICRSKFKVDQSKSFYSSFNKEQNSIKADLVLSLDVIYHLVEDSVFNEYMSRLFDTSNKFVIIYSSNYNKQLTAHVKCRKFTDWIEANVSNTWDLMLFLENRYPFNEADPNNTSMADFYFYRKKIF
ncbi:glycosyltransferase [Xanthomarina sp. GH4-25]|uniref:glycosyltransferase n=1 Tax=Xanthomarina sp. GH4-25 TaxID=3349335 RepID=UPI003877C476